jgi:hypothetical protein
MPGNKYLKGALGIAAMSASRGKNTYLSVKYKRIALRRGRVKAIVAIEHVILTATWHMLANGEVYRDPGADFYLKKEPEQTKTREPSASSKPSVTMSASHRRVHDLASIFVLEIAGSGAIADRLTTEGDDEVLAEASLDVLTRKCPLPPVLAPQ